MCIFGRSNGISNLKCYHGGQSKQGLFEQTKRLPLNELYIPVLQSQLHYQGIMQLVV